MKKKATLLLIVFVSVVCFGFAASVACAGCGACGGDAGHEHPQAVEEAAACPDCQVVDGEKVMCEACAAAVATECPDCKVVCRAVYNRAFTLAIGTKNNIVGVDVYFTFICS